MQLLWPYEITSTNNTVRCYVGTTTGWDYYTIPEGIYYPYRGQISSKWPSLFDAIETAINNATDQVRFSLATPASSNLAVGAGIQVVRLLGSGQIGWDTDWGGFDRRIIGFNYGDGGVGGIVQANTLVGNYTRAGVWMQPENCQGRRVRGDKVKEQERNNARRGAGVVTRWGVDEIRMLNFYYVPAGHVREGINESLDYASAAGLAQYDYGNQWSEFWEHGISTYRDVLAVYGEPTSLGLGDSWEVLYSLRSSDYADELSASLQERDDQAHVYDLELAMGRLPYDHPDVDGLAGYRKAV